MADVVATREIDGGFLLMATGWPLIRLHGAEASLSAESSDGANISPAAKLSPSERSGTPTGGAQASMELRSRLRGRRGK